VNRQHKFFGQIQTQGDIPYHGIQTGASINT
jgi:hypothetical protein